MCAQFTKELTSTTIIEPNVNFKYVGKLENLWKLLITVGEELPSPICDSSFSTLYKLFLFLPHN